MSRDKILDLWGEVFYTDIENQIVGHEEDALRRLYRELVGFPLWRVVRLKDSV